ncbi:hypothetical protein B0H19DRAFT_467227 [Mycena capillaripes]|nr:hypothetical protein B0H19DRAFT_467227 [Mycena capillaripes]
MYDPQMAEPHTRPSHSPHPSKTDAFQPEDTNGSDSTLVVLLTGFSILLAVLLVSAGLIIQMFVVHDFHLKGGAVYTTAPLGTTLTIVHISSVVVSMSTPLAVGLGAYWLGGEWLASSRNEGRNRPTPYQLGILMRTFSGANLSALWRGSSYIAGAGSNKTLRRPPMLRKAVLLLLAFLALAYGSTGADTWLGATSDPVLYPVATQLNSNGEPSSLLGRRVNQTLCDEWKDLPPNKPYQCGFIRGTGGNLQAISDQILTMTGVSTVNIIAFTDDLTAIIVPPTANLSEKLQYDATTFGVKSHCSSVTAQCIDMQNLGPNAGLFTDCSSVNYNTSVLGCSSVNGRAVGGPLGSDGAVLPCGQNSNSTEFRFGAKVTSAAYNVDNRNDAFVGDTGFFIHGNTGGTNVLICDVKSLNITYRYFNGSYTILASSASDLAQGQRVSDGSLSGPRFVPDAIDGAGLFSGRYNDSFASKLSQVALSMTSYVMEPTEALDMQSIESKIGSRLPLAPFLLLLAISIAYW